MTHALIIGGGIAGPVAAMALQRAGIGSVVYEAYPAGAHDTGAFLTIAVNGLSALRGLDLHRAVMARGFPTANITFTSGGGKRLGTVPIGGTLPDGTMTHTIKRAELYGVLEDEARRRGIRIEYGKRLVHAERADGGIVARFDDGMEAWGDVLIGADGIHSRTRRLIDPAAPAPRHLGQGNIGGFAPAGLVPAESGDYAMMFGRRAFFGYAVNPEGEVWWFANPPSTPGTAPTPRGAEEWRQYLLHLFAGDAGPAVDIIRATRQLVLGGDQHDLPRVPTWHRDRMIIIGDAAHAASPSSGQGASMAIEDAIVLAQCLREFPVERAFASYEQVRRPRVERVVAFGARSASTKTPGPVGRRVRDLVLPLVLKRFASVPQDWLFTYDVTSPLVRH